MKRSDIRDKIKTYVSTGSNRRAAKLRYLRYLKELNLPEGNIVFMKCCPKHFLVFKIGEFRLHIHTYKREGIKRYKCYSKHIYVPVHTTKYCYCESDETNHSSSGS